MDSDSYDSEETVDGLAFECSSAEQVSSHNLVDYWFSLELLEPGGLLPSVVTYRCKLKAGCSVSFFRDTGAERVRYWLGLHLRQVHKTDLVHCRKL